MASESFQSNIAVGHTVDEVIKSQDTGFETERDVQSNGFSLRQGVSWSVEEIVSRIWPLAVGDLERVVLPSVEDANQKLIKSWLWPGRMLQSDMYDVWSLFSRFPLLSFDTTFILSVNSTITNGGFVSLAFDNHNSHLLDRIGEINMNCVSLTNMPHVTLDLSQDSDLEFTVPFMNITAFLSGRENATFCPRSLGTLHMFRSGSIFLPESVSAPISYQLSVRFSNVKTWGYGATVSNRLVPHGIAMPSDMFNSSAPSRYLFGDREAGNKSNIDKTVLFRRHLFRNFGWSSTDPRGHRLKKNLFVHPLFVWPQNSKPNNSTYTMSTFSYLSLMYGAWQGDLRFHVTIASNQMMTGRLCVMHNPYLADIENPSAVYQNFPHVIVDIKESHTFEFDIPFLMACTRAPLHHIYLGNSWMKSSNGRIEIFVLQPLRSSTDATFSVSGQIFVEPLDNFGFSISCVPPFQSGQQPSSYLQAHGMIGKMLPPPRFSHQLSVESLMNDFFCVATLPVSGQPTATITPGKDFILRSDTTFIFPVTPILATHPDIRGNSLHPVCHVSRLYSLWTGTLRFKIVTDTNVNLSEKSIRISHLIDIKHPQVGVGHALHNTNVQELPVSCDINNLYEFDIPPRLFYDRLHITHDKFVHSAESIYNGYIKIHWPSLFAGSISIYMATGADFQLFGFVGAVDCRKFSVEVPPEPPSIGGDI